MEVKDILNTYKKNNKSIIIAIILGLIVGIGYYYLPKSYYTTGSLYITRKTEPGPEEYFKYEGYYSQQASIAHTETVTALLESIDLQSKTLLEVTGNLTQLDLMKLRRNILVKRTSPQTITITVKGNEGTKIETTWNSLVNNVSKKSTEINAIYGDEKLSINIIDKPITLQKYYPLYICTLLGGLLTGFIYTVFLTIKIYSKENKK